MIILASLKREIRSNTAADLNFINLVFKKRITKRSVESNYIDIVEKFKKTQKTTYIGTLFCWTL